MLNVQAIVVFFFGSFPHGPPLPAFANSSIRISLELTSIVVQTSLCGPTLQEIGLSLFPHKWTSVCVELLRRRAVGAPRPPVGGGLIAAAVAIEGARRRTTILDYGVCLRDLALQAANVGGRDAEDLLRAAPLLALFWILPGPRLPHIGVWSTEEAFE